MRKKRLHAIILFVLFMMLCACAAAEGRVVRVAFLEQEGMSFIGHTAKSRGIILIISKRFRNIRLAD